MTYQLPKQSPLFHAEHAQRYDRQSLIHSYEEEFDCRLVVMIDQIFGDSITMFEELIYSADPKEDLHLLLNTPGGDGETAVRIVRGAQSRCRELTVIVPDQAKSAGTLLAMGAHHILMGPTSDLGPVDPQFQVGGGSLAAAKDIIAAVDDAAARVQQAPDTYPLFASLLSDVTALMVQQARSSLERTADLVREALFSNPDRNADTVDTISEKIREPLVERPLTHAAVFGAREAAAAGLPVIEADPESRQWRMIWRLWAKYFALGAYTIVYESNHESRIIPLTTSAMTDEGQD